MALVQKMVSDITGAEAEASEFLQLVIRQHPALTDSRALDVLPGELDKLKAAGDLVVLEVGSNGDKKQLVVTLAEFRKLVKDDVVKKARATRGRRPGFSPAPKADKAPKAE